MHQHNKPAAINDYFWHLPLYCPSKMMPLKMPPWKSPWFLFHLSTCFSVKTEREKTIHSVKEIMPLFQNLCYIPLKLFLFFTSFFFYGYTCGIWKFPDYGLNQSCSCRPRPRPQQHKIWAIICDLSHSFWQHQVHNPWSKARDQTCTLMDTGWVLKPIEPQWELLSFLLAGYKD